MMAWRRIGDKPLSEPMLTRFTDAYIDASQGRDEFYSTYTHMWLSGVPDFFDRNKILSGYDLSHYQVPHCIRVFFYFLWFVFIHHNFQFYFKLCTYCDILDIYLP